MKKTSLALTGMLAALSATALAPAAYAMGKKPEQKAEAGCAGCKGAACKGAEATCAGCKGATCQGAAPEAAPAPTCGGCKGK